MGQHHITNKGNHNQVARKISIIVMLDDGYWSKCINPLPAAVLYTKTWEFDKLGGQNSKMADS